jgi:hypothetical protein
MITAALKKVSLFRLTTAAAMFGLVWVAGLAPSPAAAQGTHQQQQACTPDVMRLCNEFVPDVAKISACMARKRASVSAACRAAFPAPAHGHRTSHHRLRRA